MIFVTIGVQEPFDRLIEAMDKIAPSLGSNEVVAQISRTSYQVKNMQTHQFLTPAAYNSYFSRAQVVVSHAGMGTIISALVQKKPILVVPRVAKYGETRNDHQLATAKALESLNYVHVAYTIEELEMKLVSLLQVSRSNVHKIGEYASAELINSIKNNLYI